MGIYNVPKAIQEVYFGKTKGIQGLQKQLSIFRQKFIDNTIKFSTKINIDPELLKFNRMVEEEFGFKSFSLYVINDIYHSAYTVPIGLTPYDSVNISQSGFKFKNPNLTIYTTLVCITTGLLFDKKFSDEEILAILLHEIGHNFSQNIDKHTSIFFVLVYFVNLAHRIEELLLLILAPMVLIEKLRARILTVPVINNIFISFGDHFRKKNKNATKVFDALIGILNGINAIFQERAIMFGIIKMLFSNISRIDVITGVLFDHIKEMTPFSILSTILQYNGERVSDNFATVYGYGSELSSALAKMEFSSGGSISYKITEKVPIINNMYKLMVLPIQVITIGFDCHPAMPARINQQLIYLEKELDKDDLDPSVKDAISKDIKEVRRVLEDNLFSVSQQKIKDKIGDPYLISRVYNNMLYKMVGGDPRELLYTIDNHQQYEDAYENNKKE